MFSFAKANFTLGGGSATTAVIHEEMVSKRQRMGLMKNASEVTRELAELRRDLLMPAILVTHDLNHVLRLADRICVMGRGKILQSGVTVAVMQNPASEEIVKLLDLGREDATVPLSISIAEDAR